MHIWLQAERSEEGDLQVGLAQLHLQALVLALALAGSQQQALSVLKPAVSTLQCLSARKRQPSIKQERLDDQ